MSADRRRPHAVAAATTLDALADNPTRASALPVSAVETLLTRVHVVEGVLLARLLSLRAAPPEPATVEDAAVGIGEASRILGMRRSSLYRRWRDLGGYKDADSRIKFSRRGLARYISRRAG